MAHLLFDTGNDTQFAFYGFNAENQIEKVLLGYFDITDRCIHLTNMWGISLRDENLVEAIKFAQSMYGALKVKIQKCKIMEI